MTTLLMIFVWFDTIPLYVNITHYSCVHILNAITLMWSYHWNFLITADIISLTWSYHWCDHASKMISLILKSFCWHDHIIDMSMSVKLSSEQLSIDMIGIGWCDSYFWLSWSTLMEMTGIFDWHDWITDIVPNFKFIMSFHRRWYYVQIETLGRQKKKAKSGSLTLLATHGYAGYAAGKNDRSDQSHSSPCPSASMLLLLPLRHRPRLG